MLDKHLIAKTAPAAREENQITLDTVRITVLTERLFRIEQSPEGRFCDQATQAVWFRDLGAVDFRAEEAGEVVEMWHLKHIVIRHQSLANLENLEKFGC